MLQRGLNEIIIHTGQHHDSNMSQVFFDEMEIPLPDHFLEISSLSHGAMTGRMLEKVEEILLKEKPDCVLVYGDTNSTLAGALAASKLHIPVAHVEAGLRSFEMKMPEEVNRIITDRISTYLFCPTTTAIKNLENEGYPSLFQQVYLIGDVMYDAVLHYREMASKNSTILNDLNIGNDEFVLATIHRAENTNDLDRLGAIVSALNTISEKVRVILPLHPRTQKIITKEGIQISFEVLDPVGYFDMLTLVDKCKLVMTDSGGLQKEAYFFKKFCITLRDQTEWVELIEAGVNFLCGADTEKIIHATLTKLDSTFSSEKELYGTGNAAKQIAKLLA